MDIEKINLINDYLKEQLWMDFELCNMNCGKIEMFGFLDEGGEEKIKIVFDRPYMMLSTFCFTYEGNSDFISLVTGDEAVEINKNIVLHEVIKFLKYRILMFIMICT